jgi:hypothetical protein
LFWSFFFSVAGASIGGADAPELAGVQGGLHEARSGKKREL